jgi:hypothetical protein
MNKKINKTLQDLRYLKWTHIRSSSGTAGSFLKSSEKKGGKKIYYKLSNFDSEKGIVGHECVNEIIVDKLLSVLGVEHLEYRLLHAMISIDGREYETWLCSSFDFKQPGETKCALDSYYQATAEPGIGRLEFCREMGWQKYIDAMLAVDYLIQNRDRHGANIEVLRNSRSHTLRLAPLFDHGLSFLYSCLSEKEISEFDTRTDRPCNNFIGGRSTFDNLNLISDKGSVFSGRLTPEHRAMLFEDLEDAISTEHMDKIWEMIYERWCIYENLCNP